MLASHGGHTEVVKALLSAGADVHIKDNVWLLIFSLCISAVLLELSGFFECV